MAFFEGRQQGGELELSLRGSWRAASIPAIRESLAGLSLAGVTSVRIDAGSADELDLAGAWQLNQLLHTMKDRGLAVAFNGPPPQGLHLVQEALELEAHERPAAMRHASMENPVDRLGRTAVERLQELREGLAFVGEVTVKQLRVLGNPRRLRPTSVIRHIWDTGITAIPIVALIAFLISVIIAYLSASQLRNYGADIYVVDLITVGVLRELGVLLTAIIVAGRTGSAFAAEIGSMKLNDEIDALDATGVDPVETLILPRVLGLVIALPLLTFVADIIGLIGGALLSLWLLGMPLEQFVSRANEAIGPSTFWVGLAKAPVFALIIGLSGTYRGLQVRSSSRELGRLVTVAVVQSIFLVLLADAVFAVLFMKLDI
ncbi:MAG: hypothetical protein RL030_822 [Pseudomonadota bacterium]|jgi:phospholipid/cholesterol/gamma-HCH transport system permease protein